MLMPHEAHIAPRIAAPIRKDIMMSARFCVVLKFSQKKTTWTMVYINQPKTTMIDAATRNPRPAGTF
jgi:hypothetical protein